jgi:parvulin-like peptidyl-prolyl isomerase
MRQIVLVQNQNKALEILKKLKANPSQFAQFAQKYSADSHSHSKGGELYWLPVDSLPSEFEKVLDALNQVHLIKVKEATYLVEGLSIKRAKPVTLPDKQAEIKAAMEQEKLDQLTNQLLFDFLHTEKIEFASGYDFYKDQRQFIQKYQKQVLSDKQKLETEIKQYQNKSQQ